MGHPLVSQSGCCCERTQLVSLACVPDRRCRRTRTRSSFRRSVFEHRRVTWSRRKEHCVTAKGSYSKFNYFCLLCYKFADEARVWSAELAMAVLLELLESDQQTSWQVDFAEFDLLCIELGFIPDYFRYLDRRTCSLTTG